jgi:hypothetical protein
MKMSLYEEQAKLMKFDTKSGLSGVIMKYMRLLIQVGYIVLFAPAFPLAALVCLLANLWRIRADAYLMLFNTQRPPYKCAQDIGTLQGALQILSALAVATHVGILVFTSTQLHGVLPFTIPGIGTVTEDDKFVLLVILEHLLLAGQYVLNVLLDVFLPPTPKITSIWKAVEKELSKDREEEAKMTDAPASLPPASIKSSFTAGSAISVAGFARAKNGGAHHLVSDML